MSSKPEPEPEPEQKPKKKVVSSSYTIENIFKVPEGLDLEDNTIIECWYVKYDCLHIWYMDGRHDEITSSKTAYDDDYNDPINVEIVDAEDFGFEYLFEEEEEE
jgi:hypothetical protein